MRLEALKIKQGLGQMSSWCLLSENMKRNCKMEHEDMLLNTWGELFNGIIEMNYIPRTCALSIRTRSVPAEIGTLKKKLRRIKRTVLAVNLADHNLYPTHETLFDKGDGLRHCSAPILR